MSENVDMVRASIEAHENEDLDALRAMVHPDVEVHEWPEAPDPHVYRGLDGLREAEEKWAEAWEYIRAEPRDFAEAQDRVLVFVRSIAKGRGSAIEVELDTFAVYTFRDSKVAKVQYFTDRGAALAAAGLSEEELRQEAK